MAEEQLTAVLTGIQAMLSQQAAATSALAQRATTVESRFAQGEANLQTVVTTLENRLADAEK